MKSTQENQISVCIARALGACLAGAGSTVVAFVDSAAGSAVERVGLAFRTTATRLRQPGKLAYLRGRTSGTQVT
jgi:homoserine kinase